MERMFERAYARAEGRLSQAEAAAYGGAGAGTSGGHGGADAGPSSCGGGKGGAAAETPLAELKPVQRILKCWETKDYFRWAAGRQRRTATARGCWVLAHTSLLFDRGGCGGLTLWPYVHVRPLLTSSQPDRAARAGGR